LGLPGVETRHLVAVTFTRKAAANLRFRIDEALLARERNDAAGGDAWRRHREAMPWARIGTIHGLCTSLLRAFPLEARVDPAFSIGLENEDLTERVHNHVGRAARRRDPDLARLIDLLRRRDRVEKLVLLVLTRLDLVRALDLLSGDPEGARRYLLEQWEALARRFDTDLAELPPDHEPYLDHLQLLHRFTRPLLEELRGPRTRLSYDDLEQFTLRLLEDHPGAARRIRAGIRFLLVDEFQDTSRLQWEILRRLALDDDGRFQPERLFLVGDVKQSIYGFRSADVTVLGRAREAMGIPPGSEEGPRQVSLDDNFRSLPGVLRPLNAVFARLLAPEEEKEAHPFEAEHQELVPQRSEPPGGTAPRVEVELVDTKTVEVMFAHLADRLKALLIPPPSNGPHGLSPGGEPAGGENRRWQPEEIAILLRRRTNLDELEAALRDAGVPYTVFSGRGFYRRQEILDLRNLVAALADRRDRLALAGVLRSPLFQLSDAALAALFLPGGEPESVWERLAAGRPAGGPAENLLLPEDRETLAAGYTVWRELRRRVGLVPPSDLLLYALEANGGWAGYGSGPLGGQRVANLYQFIAQVRELCAAGADTFRRLSRRIREIAELEEVQEADTGTGVGKSVKVMTVHAAKGLEFPMVVLTDLGAKPQKPGFDRMNRGGVLLAPSDFTPLAQPELVHLSLTDDEDRRCLHRLMRERIIPTEELAEIKRLLYVAATRARDRLLVVDRLPRNRKKQVELPEKSPLTLWVNACGVQLDENGRIEKETDIEGLAVRVVEAEETL
ncbi:MAG TPA: hypothetical protein ENI92_09760, partial [Bacteroidetes bacterium]|nr:hypothetical protein [Bacteroidota bacterium]